MKQKPVPGQVDPHPWVAHLSRDKRMAKLIAEQGPRRKLKKHHNLTMRLYAAILSQQLSTRVAEIIYRRFLDLYGKEEPTPRQVLATPHEIFRSIGLSNAKATYVKHIAEFALEKGLDARRLSKLSDEEVIQYLLPIKGVGRWTAEMLLIFTLGREDVFAPDDLGLQQAMARIYRLDPSDKKQLRADMLRISARWSPYRSYACLYLWDWHDFGVR